MSEISFYHTSQSRINDILINLIMISVKSGWKSVVQFTNQEKCDIINLMLWTWSKTSFIAHGTTKDKYPDKQPILLTTDDRNLNFSCLRFFVEGSTCKNPEIYKKIIIIFDGFNKKQIIQARKDWKIFKDQGHKLNYWKK